MLRGHFIIGAASAAPPDPDPESKIKDFVNFVSSCSEAEALSLLLRLLTCHVSSPTPAFALDVRFLLLLVLLV